MCHTMEYWKIWDNFRLHYPKIKGNKKSDDRTK